MGQQFCELICPAGKTVQKECSSWTGCSISCIDCPKNTYKINESSEPCMHCSYGFDTKGKSGSKHCTQTCSVGQYYNLGYMHCTNCPINTFKHTIGHTEKCEDCKLGYNTNGKTGQSKCFKSCPPGQYSRHEENCTKCEVDTYKEGHNVQLCEKCEDGWGTGKHIGVSQCLYRICPAGMQHSTENCGEFEGRKLPRVVPTVQQHSQRHRSSELCRRICPPGQHDEL